MMLLRYYHNITSNTLVVLEAMAAHGVNTLIYSSTCATYGEPEKMPITEQTPQVKVGWSTCSFQIKNAYWSICCEAFDSDYLRSLGQTTELENFQFVWCFNSTE